MAWDFYCIQEFLPNVAFAYVIDIFIAQFTFQIFFLHEVVEWFLN